LPPLSATHLSALVSETFEVSPDRAEPLARLLSVKTAGNPFFVNQLLGALQEQGLVTFNYTTGAFTWDIEAVERSGFTDEVVDLMVAKLRGLTGRTREALMLASCIGTEFDAAFLATIQESTLEHAHEDLNVATAEGLVTRRGEVYSFLHDRIQQAAYSFIPEERRGEVHLRIGRLLLGSTPSEEVPRRVFDIVNQLN